MQQRGAQEVEAGRQRFLAALSGADTGVLAEALVTAVRGLAWRDTDGQAAAPPPDGARLEASTFGEPVVEPREQRLGPWTLTWPAPTAPRAAGLRLVDPATGAAAVVDDLLPALLAAGDPALVEVVAMAAARAAWPDDDFRWTGTAVARRWRVVGEVERWPGEIQLQAARVYDPTLRIGDGVWLSDRERLPSCWVLDVIADR